MSEPKLIWDQIGERYYETGTKKGVLYLQDGTAYPKGVAWSGLSAVSESPDGAEASPIYADDIKFLNLRSVENFKGSIEAYMYPDEWEECDGSRSPIPGVKLTQQKRKPFGFSYVTTIGNDTEFDDFGYKIHLIYGATASASERAYKTINDSPEAITFSWEFDTIPVQVPGYNALAHMEIDSTKTDPIKMAELEEILYGKAHELLTSQPQDWTTNYKNYFTKDETGKFVPVSGASAPSWAANKYYTPEVDARLPLPAEVIQILTPDP